MIVRYYSISPGLQLENINQDGCFEKLKGDVEENVTILGSVAIGIGFVQVSKHCCYGTDTIFCYAFYLFF